MFFDYSVYLFNDAKFCISQFVKHRNGSYMFEVKLILIMTIIMTFHLRMDINCDYVFQFIKNKNKNQLFALLNGLYVSIYTFVCLYICCVYIYLNMCINTNVFNTQKRNATICTKKLFLDAKNQALAFRNKFSVHIVAFHFFCDEGILSNKDQNIITLLKNKGCTKLSSISLVSRSKWWLVCK